MLLGDGRRVAYVLWPPHGHISQLFSSRLRTSQCEAHYAQFIRSQSRAARSRQSLAVSEEVPGPHKSKVLLQRRLRPRSESQVSQSLSKSLTTFDGQRRSSTGLVATATCALRTSKGLAQALSTHSARSRSFWSIDPFLKITSRSIWQFCTFCASRLTTIAISTSLRYALPKTRRSLGWRRGVEAAPTHGDFATSTPARPISSTRHGVNSSGKAHALSGLVHHAHNSAPSRISAVTRRARRNDLLWRGGGGWGTGQTHIETMYGVGQAPSHVGRPRSR